MFWRWQEINKYKHNVGITAWFDMLIRRCNFSLDLIFPMYMYCYIIPMYMYCYIIPMYMYCYIIPMYMYCYIIPESITSQVEHKCNHFAKQMSPNILLDICVDVKFIFSLQCHSYTWGCRWFDMLNRERYNFLYCLNHWYLKYCRL